MAKRIITFGEILLRFTTPGHFRLQQARSFDTNFGGSEANVAVSIANYGGDVAFVSCLPDNPLGEIGLMRLREHRVNADHVMMVKNERLGTYYFEKAADMRKSTVIYDRSDSAFAHLVPGMINWEKIFQGAEIFHFSGIDAALTQGLTDVCFEAIEIAEKMGLKISCDINYRKNLWQYGKTAEEVLVPLMQHADILFGSSSEYEKALGLKDPKFKCTSSADHIDTYAYQAYCEKVKEMMPKAEYIFICLRNVMSTEHHVIGGVLYSEGSLKYTRVYNINNVIDCLGVGDAFVGAMLYACQHYKSDQDKVDFATAGSVLKNTIVGDYNIVSKDEVESLMKGGDAEVGR